MIKVLFICHGNICRSTLAESVFTHKVKALGLANQFVIDSSATSREEIGNPPHRGTVNKLREVGIPLVPHRAKQITLADYDKSIIHLPRQYTYEAVPICVECLILLGFSRVRGK